MTKFPVLLSPIDAIDWDGAIHRISAWASLRESRMVAFCNVHSVVTAHREIAFRRIIEGADLAAPDGAPIAWVMRRLGAKGQERINGPDFMWRYLNHAEQTGESIFLYGGTRETLEALRNRIQKTFPRLTIAGSLAPPFRDLSAEEDQAIIQEINQSGAQTIWVSLGCPKQERWMADHRGVIQGVMLGVGAAFNYHAGTLKRAPFWMQRLGLEWLYRFTKEPRLWRRYLDSNTHFIIAILRSW